MLRKILRQLPPYLPTAIVTIAILYLTLVPKPLPDNDIMLIPGMDKIVHALMFGGFTLTLSVDRSRRKKSMPAVSKGKLALFVIIAAGFGAAVEIAQQLMGLGRGGDIFDFIADSCGAIIFAMLANPVIRILR